MSIIKAHVFLTYIQREVFFCLKLDKLVLICYTVFTVKKGRFKYEKCITNRITVDTY